MIPALTDCQNVRLLMSFFMVSFNCLQMVRAFTRNDVTIEAEKGGQFVLFNGMVTGEFTELVGIQ